MASVITTAILRTQTDERLVALARGGHKRAFEAIAERYRPELTRALRRILPNAAVEDALQQTHLQAWQALAGGTEVRELRPWLHRIARNAAIAAASRGYDYDELKDALLVTPGPHDDLERRDAVRRALRGIAELPERQRDALLAVAVEGRSHAELALELGITDTAARQLVRRARVSLLALMSVATPPQLVRWAARGGGSARGGVAAGKAAAGKAAAGPGIGIGGSIGGSALKVGVVAVTLGGVAAGVAPIRHVFVAPAKPAAAHRHRADPGHATAYLAAAALTPLNRGSRAPKAPAGASRSTAREHRAVSRPATPGGAAVGSTVSAAAVTSPTTSAATSSSTQAGSAGAAAGSATSSSKQTVALLAAWWLTHHADGRTGAGRTTAAGERPSARQGLGAASGAAHIPGFAATGGDSPRCSSSSPAAPSSSDQSGSSAGSTSASSGSSAGSTAGGSGSASGSTSGSSGSASGSTSGSSGSAAGSTSGGAGSSAGSTSGRPWSQTSSTGRSGSAASSSGQGASSSAGEPVAGRSPSYPASGGSSSIACGAVGASATSPGA
jgi:RNA polymerase sigma factor (sigma-70 family)